MKKNSREEYDSMMTAQQQNLYVLQCKAGILNGKKTPESSKALEVRVAMLQAKQKTISMRTFWRMKSPMLIEIIQPLTGRDAKPDRAI